jgi:ubiquinone/menaquinone biosynthesis C-methylase UbiE
MELSDHARQNRESWDAAAEAYQARNARAIEHDAPHWGMWQIPESELNALGELNGREVLELGCGAGQFGLSLVRQGARVTGIDNSAKQLEFARANVGDRMTLVHGSAEELPFADASFDVVCCDHGAVGFTDPRVVVPEVARVLRPGGRFAFSGLTPIEWITFDGETSTTALQRDYFGMGPEETDGIVEFMLTYGDWIRVFAGAGFAIRDLIEVRPPEGATSTYRDAAETEWARHWPMEQIWVVDRVVR